MDELQIWWQNISPEMQAVVQAVGLAIAALVVGQFVGVMTARTLRARNFDALLRLPSTSLPADPDSGITPTFIAGLLVRLTVWAGAAWWFARQHGQVELAATLGLIIKRTWLLASVLVAALALGSLLARRLIECLRGHPAAVPDSLASRNGPTARHWDAAGAVGASVYLLVVQLALLTAADLFDWPLARSSAVALWQITLHLMVAGAALVIGSLGARWARDQVTTDIAVSPEKRAGQYTALAIVAGSTVLAVAVLLSSAGMLIGLAALCLLGFAVWTVRGYLPDIGAGLQLRSYKVREVLLDGAQWHVAEVGFLTTQVTREGAFWRLQNRLVLKACMEAQQVEPVEVTQR
jgi:hypothetical protein